MIDEDIENGEVFVNSETSHVNAGRAPIGHQQPFNSGTTERGDETVSWGEVRDSRAVQRERRAQQGWNAALGHRKVTQADGTQFECNPAWRGPFRLLRGVLAAGIA